ncbi:MAG: response regulator [Bacteroidia bacterium]|nr:response regulator [Bacteroidia bacterium]
MINAVIIDDEQAARTALQTIIKEYCKDVHIAGTAASAIEGLKLIQQQSPDLVFLDIEMPMGSGFDLLELSMERNYKVVFTTAHQQYALKAIKNSAADYLLKPIDIDELIETVEKIKKILDKEKEQNSKTNYKLKLSGQKETILVSPLEVVYVEADGRYSTVHLLSGEKHVVSRNIGEFEEELTSHGFFRVHKSYLVNCKHVAKINSADGGFVEMNNKTEIEISKRKKAEFLKLLK